MQELYKKVSSADIEQYYIISTFPFFYMNIKLVFSSLPKSYKNAREDVHHIWTMIQRDWFKLGPKA